MFHGRLEGGCRCGNIRYEITGDISHTAVCHCKDCRRSAGAPIVAWVGVKSDSFRILKGEPRVWSGYSKAKRFFCAECGTGIYYENDTLLPGLVDVTLATLDDPEQCPPQIHVQVAEKLSWIEDTISIPAFQRYPPA